MSGPALCMLVRLMVAQVQECVFERVTLTSADTPLASQLRLAQEAARVGARRWGKPVAARPTDRARVCFRRCRTCTCWCSKPWRSR